MRTSKVSILAILMLIGCTSFVRAGVMLPAPIDGVTSLTFGDMTVYSMAALNSIALGEAASPKPGDPFHVKSAPGEIQGDTIVLLSGAGGQTENNQSNTTLNTAIDNAYAATTGVGAFFGNTVGAGSPVDPAGGPALDGATTWDVATSTLRSAVGAGEELVFWFNLNEAPSGTDDLAGQDILASAVFSLIDDDLLNPAPTLNFYLSASDDPSTGANERTAGLASWTADGAPEPNPALDPVGTSQLTPDNRWAYVHGKITVSDNDGSFLHQGGIDGTEDPLDNAKEINQNLGANVVAFALFNQLMSSTLLTDLRYDRFTADLYLSRIDNGGEQLFVMGAKVGGTVDVVPEPTSILAWSLLGGFGLAFSSRRSRLRRRDQR